MPDPAAVARHAGVRCTGINLRTLTFAGEQENLRAFRADWERRCATLWETVHFVDARYQTDENQHLSTVYVYVRRNHVDEPTATYCRVFSLQGRVFDSTEAVRADYELLARFLISIGLPFTAVDQLLKSRDVKTWVPFLAEKKGKALRVMLNAQAPDKLACFLPLFRNVQDAEVVCQDYLTQRAALLDALVAPDAPPPTKQRFKSTASDGWYRARLVKVYPEGENPRALGPAKLTCLLHLYRHGHDGDHDEAESNAVLWDIDLEHSIVELEALTLAHLQVLSTEMTQAEQIETLVEACEHTPNCQVIKCGVRLEDGEVADLCTLRELRQHWQEPADLPASALALARKRAAERAARRQEVKTQNFATWPADATRPHDGQTLLTGGRDHSKRNPMHLHKSLVPQDLLKFRHCAQRLTAKCYSMIRDDDLHSSARISLLFRAQEPQRFTDTPWTPPEPPPVEVTPLCEGRQRERRHFFAQGMKPRPQPGEPLIAHEDAVRAVQLCGSHIDFQAALKIRSVMRQEPPHPHDLVRRPVGSSDAFVPVTAVSDYREGEQRFRPMRTPKALGGAWRILDPGEMLIEPLDTWLPRDRWERYQALSAEEREAQNKSYAPLYPIQGAGGHTVPKEDDTPNVYFRIMQSDGDKLRMERGTYKDPYVRARLRHVELGTETFASAIPGALRLPDVQPENEPGIQEQYGEEFE